MKFNLFVYGTLKHGGSNHRLMQGQHFVANVVTQPRYKLFALDSYPALIETATGGCSIEGELWSVDEGLRPALDRLEGVSEGLYKRAAIPLLPPFHTLDVQGYVYLCTVAGRRDCGSRWEA